MFGRGSDDEESNAAETPDNDPREDETVTLVEDTEGVFEYTEHEAVAGFVGGVERTFTFDEMEESRGGAYILYDYDGVRTGCGSVNEVGPDGQIKVATIERENLLFFDTVSRESKELTTDIYNEWDMSRREAEEYIENDDEDIYHIEEIDEE